MTPYRYVPSTPGDVVDRLGALFLCLPEYQLPHSDLDMAGEFLELRESLGIIRPKLGEEKYAALMEMSHESERLYFEGKNRDGAFILRDMKALLLKRK